MSEMELKGKKVAVIVDNIYQELEVWYPLLRFQEAGAEVVTVGAVAGQTYTSKLGYPVKADKSYKEVKASDFDGIVIPGGYAPDHIRRHPEAIQFVKDMNDRGGLLAAICHGPWVLCSTPALRNRTVTCFFAIKDDVINAGGKYVDQEVAVDGHIVTSRKPEDLPAFCRESIRVLAGRR